ncbi:MAG TPA: TRAP transporter substrate-binding protein DctP [Vicinamibacteria bacterium]|nr:TRAP transporter substrate-binding protein DctP [Vicinamibacteria bacterium]
MNRLIPGKRLARAAVVAASALAAATLAIRVIPGADAQAPLIVRMATLVPEGSSWHLVLKETLDKWKTISGGRVVVRLFPGGVAGDDPDVVRKMRLGTLNAGVLTEVGVAEIDKSVYALGVPLMYDSYEEVYYVLEKMQPRLEASLEAKGFVVLNWADGGWVHFFTQKPVAVPDDLRALKLFSWAGDAQAVEVWRSAGFNPVPLPSTEISTALQTGLVNALGAPPQVAVISQFFNYARNMTELHWQLLLGATLITKSTWEKIPADLRPAMLEATREAGRRLQQEVRQSEAKDVEAMKKRGLNVVPVSPKQRAEWYKLTEAMYPKIRGEIVPADAFDAALRYRDEYRKRSGAANR